MTKTNKSKTIITAFRQHGFGNCTSIGVIKAAIEIFGIDGVFSIQKSGTKNKVLLKNGAELEISDDELKAAENSAGFQLLDPNDAEKVAIRTYAIVCFAVICKSKQVIEEYDSYQDAIDDVNTGESVFDGPSYLGLDNFTVGVKYKDVDSYGGIVAHSSKHTVYVSYGYFDDYGFANLLNSIWEWMRFGRKVYRFEA